MVVVSSQARTFVQSILNGYDAKAGGLNVSRGFASARFLDPPSADYEARGQHEASMMETARAQLVSAQYHIDPMSALVSFAHTRIAALGRMPPPPRQYIDAKRHFFSHIFQIAYGKSDDAGKIKIIAELAPFQAKLNSLSFRCQRVIFKIEGMLSNMSADDYVKIGVCVVIAATAFLSVKTLQPIAVQFFSSAAFTEPCLVFVNRLPVVMITAAKEAYQRAVYVVSTRVFRFFFINGLVERLVCMQIPVLSPVYTVINLVDSPARTFASMTGFFFYNRSIGPDARAQEAISESLEDLDDRRVADQLLSEGMKAYQVWMYLVEEGPQQRLFVR
jgi:hypothetical protein